MPCKGADASRRCTEERWILKPAVFLPVSVSGADAVARAPSRRLDLGRVGCETWGAPAGSGGAEGSRSRQGSVCTPGQQRFRPARSHISLSSSSPAVRAGARGSAPLRLATRGSLALVGPAAAAPGPGAGGRRAAPPLSAASSLHVAPALARLCFQGRSAARLQTGLRLTVHGRVRACVRARAEGEASWDRRALCKIQPVTVETGSPPLVSNSSAANILCLLV